MPYAYLNNMNDVIALGTIPRDPADLKQPAVARIDNAPDGLMPFSPDVAEHTSFHRYVPANGDGTSISHYVVLGDLAEYRRKRYKEIDQRTRELIDTGFLHSNTVFSLSLQAQINWNRLRMNILTGVLTALDFPQQVATIDDANFSLPGLTAAAAFYANYTTTLEGRLNSGRQLKAQIAAAATKAQIDAIVDDRQPTAVPMGSFAAKRQEELTGIYVDWNYEVVYKTAGKVSKIERYATDNGDGTYSGLIETVDYTYEGDKLVSTVTTTYDDLGTVINTETQNFFTNTTNKTTIRKFS